MFPETFSYEERADLIRMEFDRRAPKIRLSIFAYLVEAGILGEGTIGVEEFMELMNRVHEFISHDVEAYAVDVAKLEPDEKPETDKKGDGTPELFIVEEGGDPYGHNGGGHL